MVDAPEFTAENNEHAPFLRWALDAYTGPTCELVYVRGKDHNYLIFRAVHAVMDGHPTAVAGEEGIVTLHVGQPSKACVVSVEIEPTSKRAKQRHPEENLKRASAPD